MFPLPRESTNISSSQPIEIEADEDGTLHVEHSLQRKRERCLSPERRSRPRTLEMQMEQQARAHARSLQLAQTLKTMRQNGLELAHASISDQNNPHVVFTAVHQNGLAIQYASVELRDTLNIGLAAVSKNGLALQYLSDKLRRTYLLVKKAVQQNGLALQDAHPSLQNNRDIAREACKQTKEAQAFVGEELKALPFYVLMAPISEGNN